MQDVIIQLIVYVGLMCLLVISLGVFVGLCYIVGKPIIDIINKVKGK